MPTLTSEQIRAARALLRWEQKDLAEASGISLPSIKRLEAQSGLLAAQDRTVKDLEEAIEMAGVAFVLGSNPGVVNKYPVQVAISIASNYVRTRQPYIVNDIADGPAMPPGSIARRAQKIAAICDKLDSMAVASRSGPIASKDFEQLCDELRELKVQPTEAHAMAVHKAIEENR